MTEISPNLFRGSKEDAFEAIRTRKIDVVINLETETRELIFGGANDELILCHKHGVHMFDFALSGIVPPDFETVKVILEVIREHLQLGMRVMFHCRKGHERTGFIAAAWRMNFDGYSFDRAYQEWKDMGCHWPYYWLWKKELKKWEVK